MPDIQPIGGAEEPAKPKYRYVLPPIRVWGEVSYDIREQGGEDRQTTRDQYLNLSVNAETFIWQPWFGTLTGGLGLLTSTTGGSVQQDSTTVTGNLLLALFPQSRFPFQAHYDRTDSRTDGYYLGTQFVSTRYGFNQRYSPMGGSSNYLLIYDHGDQERADGITDRYDGWQLNVNQRYGPHFFDFAGSLTTNESSDGILDNSYRGLVLHHTYVPHGRLNVDNLASLTQTEDKNNLNDVQTTYLQFNSFLSWRPENDRWYVSGGFRALQHTSETPGSSSETRSLSANVGATYQLDRHTRLNGAATVTYNTPSNESNFLTTQSLGLTYQPDVIPLGAYQYQWFTGASVSNRSGGNDSGQHLATQLGHAVDRSIELSPRSSLAFNLSQGLTADADTRTDSVVRFNHSASVTWSMGRGESTAYVRFSASDARTLNGRQDSFQLLNFQASLNHVQNRNSTWNGNLTIQATRNSTEESPDQGFALTSGGDLTYLDTAFMNIRRLRFQSQLRLNQNSFSQQATGPLTPAVRDQESISWENKLEYIVGRTTIAFTARISEINGKQHDLLQLKLVRQFGDL